MPPIKYQNEWAVLTDKKWFSIKADSTFICLYVSLGLSELLINKVLDIVLIIVFEIKEALKKKYLYFWQRHIDVYWYNVVIIRELNRFYPHTSNIYCTLLGNKIVDHSDAVGVSPVGAAPTTSSKMEWTKTTARREEKHLDFGIWCVLH